MSLTLTIFLLVSLAGTLAMIIFFFLRHNNKTQFSLSLAAWVAALVLLYLLFFSHPVPTPKSSAGNDILFLLILYACMLLGMLAEQGYAYFAQPRSKRKRKKKFDIGPLLLPAFTAPIVFIPLFAALQNADIDLMQLTAPRLMVFFVAFENGFFWKGYITKRREEREQNHAAAKPAG